MLGGFARIGETKISKEQEIGYFRKPTFMVHACHLIRFMILSEDMQNLAA